MTSIVLEASEFILTKPLIIYPNPVVSWLLYLLPIIDNLPKVTLASASNPMCIHE